MMSATVLPVNATAHDFSHYVDWGAILAGAFVTAAISSVFLAFGSAVGLSLSSFTSGGSAPALGLAAAAALWLLWVQISSFIGGGYVAGRLRRRIGDATPDEVTMRDGSHGLIVWAVGVVAAAGIALWLALAGTMGAAASMDYTVDRLLRADVGTAPLDGAGDTKQIGRALAVRIAATNADAADSAFLVREITARTGLPEADAAKRLELTVADLKTKAETARRYGILIAFLTAASLLVSAAAAWWAASTGGRHRNEGVDHTHLTVWR